MKLRCVSRYASRDEVYQVGDVIDVEPAHAARLRADSPGSFVEIAVEESPARSRQVRKPPKTRAMPEPEEDGDQ